MKSDRVAVLDDMPYLRDELAEHISQSGLRPVVIMDIPVDARAAADIVCRKADYAVCDQRIGPFEGAEVIARVTERNKVGVLVTQYVVGEDVPKYRHLLDRIPKQMSRDEFQAQDVREIFSQIEEDLRQQPKERKPYKALIRVQEVMPDGAIRVIVPAWHPRREVEMYVIALPAEQRTAVHPGSRLWGSVNLRAASEDDLYITNVHLGPEPDRANYILRA